MTYVFLGNRRAWNDAPTHDDGRIKTPDEREPHVEGKNRTEVQFPTAQALASGAIELGPDFAEMFTTIAAPGGIWTAHSPDPAPAWVASDDALLAQALGRHYGCEVRAALPAGEREEHFARAHHFVPGDGLDGLHTQLVARIADAEAQLAAVRAAQKT